VTFDQRIEHNATWPKKNIAGQPIKYLISFTVVRNKELAKKHMNFIKSRKDYKHFEGYKFRN